LLRSSSLSNPKRLLQSRNCHFISNRSFLIEECKKNQKFYTEISRLYPIGRYLGVVNQQVVAEGNSKLEVEKKTMEEFLKWTNGEYPEVIPTVVRRVGFEDEVPQVIVIEPKQSEVAFHSSKTLHLDWKSVALPVKTELETDITLDRFWHNIRFVGPDTRPFVTVATSFKKDSACFPMTFFIDTGSPANFIKRSAFDIIPTMEEKTDTNEKILYIGGEPFMFFKSPKDSAHSNINLIGTPVLHALDFLMESYLQAIRKFKTNKICEEGRNVPPQESDWK